MREEREGKEGERQREREQLPLELYIQIVLDDLWHAVQFQIFARRTKTESENPATSGEHSP